MRTKKLLSVLMAGILVLSSMGFTAFAEAGTIPVETLEDLKAALDAEAGSTVTVTGDIALDGPITFANPITFEIAEGGTLSYTSDTNSQLYLVTLQGGSTFNLAEGAQVVMNGDEGTQDANRDWRAVYSNGDLVCDTLAGSITINHARGRALYANNDLTIGDMAADILMNNPNGVNRYMYGIVSYGGNITMDTLSGSVKTVFGGGNNGYAIAAQAGSVTINGDITGTVETQLGTSHAGIAIYAANSVTVTGDISGSVYARGGSGSGYAIYAGTGDVAVASISGTVAGDCYNEIMENSQTGASAIYAGGSIYGSNDGGYTPINLTGTLSSKVGRSDAYTVNAGGSVYIHIAGEGKILAQSSYGADFQGLEPGYEPMTNNWGGVAAGVIGNDIHVTGNNGAITVVSESETGTPVGSSALVESTTRENINAVSSLLYNVARGDTEAAKKIAATMTDEQKGLITDFEEIEEGLTSIRVTDAASLAQALLDAESGAVIVLQAGEYDMSAAAADSVLYVRKPVTIRSEGDVIFKGSARIESSDVTIEGLKFTNPVIIPYGDVEPICIDINTGSYDNIAIRGCTFETEQYAASTGKRYKGIVTSSSGTYNGFTVDGCTFINLETAITINQGASGVIVSDNEMTGTGSIFNKASFLKTHGTEGLTVTGNTVDNANIYLRPDFGGNAGSGVVIAENKLTGLSIIMDNEQPAVSDTVDISRNYWGKTPSVDSVVSGAGSDSVQVELNSYYEDESMNELTAIDVASLDAALAAAKDGDVINVPAGIYPDNITIDKAITLKGSEDAVFTGIITVSADGAALEGINLRYEGSCDAIPYGNILIHANNVTVTDCSFYAKYDESPRLGREFGMVRSTDNYTGVVFDGCSFETNTMGIFPMANSGEIKDCTFKPIEGFDICLAINGTNMADVSLTGNVFEGMPLLTNSATIENNQFLNYTGAIFQGQSYLPEDMTFDVTGNYWGSANPDFDTIWGTDKVVAEYYYANVDDEGNLTDIVYIEDDPAAVEKEIVFEQIDGGNTFNMYLQGSTGDGDLAQIVDLVSVDMLISLTGTFDYSFVPADDEWTYERYDNELLIYEKGKLDGEADLSGQKIHLGILTLEGYGAGTISASAARENSVMQRGEEGNDPNLAIHSELAAGEALAFTLSRPTQNLTINITFPNSVEENVAAYQQMSVTISGGDLADDLVYTLGSDDVAMADGQYTITVADTLTQNTAYNVTVEGLGYRTARYSVNMGEEDKTLNFWNSVKGVAEEVETGKETSKETVTFLAGDIVKDSQINLYDLSAVVSYFGTIDLSETNHPEYAKYDLNRDGKIDSKDVAYVLVSWGK